MSISFNSIDGTIAKENGSNITFNLYGSNLEKVKKKLTLTNKSILFQLKKAKENLDHFSQIAQSQLNHQGQISYQVEKSIVFYTNKIKELQKDAIQEYFIDHGSHLEITSGFWWLAEKIEGDFHLNTEIKPYYIDFLRDYQKEAINELIKYKRATCVLSTGLGKSLCIASLTISAVNSGKRVFIIVPTEYLVGQVYDTIKKFISSVTAYGGKRKNPIFGSDVFVCTVNSAKQFIGSYDVVITDESHHISSRTWTEALLAAEKSQYVYNFTATPFRSDGLDLAIHAFGGKTVINKSVRWGIENGWLANPSIYITEIDTGLRLTDKTVMASAYKKLVQTKPVMELVKTKALSALSKGRKVLVLFKTVNAGLQLKKIMANDFQFNVASSKNKKPIDDFKQGLTSLLVSNDKLLSEGVDIPDIDTLIVVLQNSSDTMTYQALGRALRKSPNKQDVIVLDVAVKGYNQFERAKIKRADVYRTITNNIKVL